MTLDNGHAGSPRATAIPCRLDDGAIVYLCGGKVIKHGDTRPVPCRQRLFTWQSQIAAALDSVGGRIVTKCRRCKEENEAVVGYAMTKKGLTAAIT